MYNHDLFNLGIVVITIFIIPILTNKLFCICQE